jgi:hypothetical protein
MVRGGDHAVVRVRPDHAEAMAQDRMPDWLDDADDALSRGAA